MKQYFKEAWELSKKCIKFNFVDHKLATFVILIVVDLIYLAITCPAAFEVAFDKIKSVFSKKEKEEM